MTKFPQRIWDAVTGGVPFALGMITRIRGSSPQKNGAKALFFADGRIVGTLGGGCLEAEIQDRARRALITGQAAKFDLVLDHDFGWDDGLICGGRVSGLILPKAHLAEALWRRLATTIEPVTWGVRGDFSLAWDEVPSADWLYVETVRPPVALWIAGAGHVAQAVVPLALQLDFEPTVFDDRAALGRNFPRGTRYEHGPWDQLLARELPDRPTFGLILTRGHQHDARVLAEWIRRPFAFLGMIGSRRKRRIITEELEGQGTATRERLEALACPVGLDIGAVSVAEIGISIAAQLVTERSRRVTGSAGPGDTAAAMGKAMGAGEHEC